MIYDALIIIFTVANVVAWLFLLPLKWVRKVAKRNQRSVSGFCWLYVVAPLIAWAILLTIDRRENTG